MKRLIVTVAALMFVLVPMASFAAANAVGAGPAAQDPAADETAAYKAWYDAYTAKDWPKALDLAKTYVEKFPAGKQIDYMKKWIPQARAKMLGDAAAAKNLPEIVRIGKDIMSAEPESVDFSLYLTGQLRSLDTGFQYSQDTALFAQTSMRLIESGKTPAPVQGQPPFDKSKTLAFLHETLASLDEHNKDADKALRHFEDAAGLDPMNPSYFFQCGRIHTTKYQAASTAYDKFSEADKTAPEPKPEVKAALDLANAEADGVINCWARFLGLTAADLKGFKSEVRQQVMKSVGDLYEYRNANRDGLTKLIDDNKGPAPVKMTPPAKPAPQKAEDEAGAKPGSPAAPGTTAKPAARKPHS